MKDVVDEIIDIVSHASKIASFVKENHHDLLYMRSVNKVAVKWFIYANEGQLTLMIERPAIEDNVDAYRLKSKLKSFAVSSSESHVTVKSRGEVKGYTLTDKNLMQTIDAQCRAYKLIIKLVNEHQKKLYFSSKLKKLAEAKKIWGFLNLCLENRELMGSYGLACTIDTVLPYNEPMFMKTIARARRLGVLRRIAKTCWDELMRDER